MGSRDQWVAERLNSKKNGLGEVVWGRNPETRRQWSGGFRFVGGNSEFLGRQKSAHLFGKDGSVLEWGNRQPMPGHRRLHEEEFVQLFGNIHRKIITEKWVEVDMENWGVLSLSIGSGEAAWGMQLCFKHRKQGSDCCIEYNYSAPQMQLDFKKIFDCEYWEQMWQITGI